MKKLLFFPLIAIIIINFSCTWMGKRVKGDGNIKTESFTSESFTGVDASGAFEVYIKQDSVASIRVEADQNLMEHISIAAPDGILHIRSERGYRLKPTRRIKVYVSTTTLKSVRATGACNIYGENKISCPSKFEIEGTGACNIKLDINSPTVSVDLSGACDVNLSGETRDFTVEGSGSTGIKCFTLMAENVKIDISGAGDAEVFASVKLDVDVSGAGTVRYKGNAVVSQDISGAGSVKKVEF